jgi:adenosylcobinamide-GDP ribazoletransferase
VNAGKLSLRATGPLAPLVGILIGALGGVVYWLASQLWPSSVALILAMAATVFTATVFTAPVFAATAFHATTATRFDVLARMLLLFIKFNALMALSAAKLPFAAPANSSLGLIMICGYAASYALLVFIMATRTKNSEPGIGHAALLLALGLGFVPAALLGIPGLIGLAAALVAGLALMAFLKSKPIGASGDALEFTQLSTEASFYLGALASWRFV